MSITWSDGDKRAYRGVIVDARIVGLAGDAAVHAVVYGMLGARGQRTGVSAMDGIVPGPRIECHSHSCEYLGSQVVMDGWVEEESLALSKIDSFKSWENNDIAQGG